MTHEVSWWLAVEVLGLAALPLAWRLFRNLPDRGYPLAKPLGLLLTCYLFWLSGSLGFLANTRSAIVLCAVVVAAGSALVHWRRTQPSADGAEDEGLLTSDGLLQFLRRNLGLVAANEVLFAVALGLWALVRAYNPGISGTEKPMDFAFLNAILRSEYFPPLDPWLSGFAISYYYFGYLIVATVTRLAGVPSEVAFNLAIALLFALTANGAFSLTYNLVARREATEGRGKALPMAFGALGAVFVAVMGNLEGFLEVLHTRGLGSSSFWEWIDVKDLASAPVSGSWIPTDNWWWWRASRVVHDVVAGMHQEVIDEFPFFSFLLGDMHPHVLGLPFVLLALGLCLNLLWSRREAAWWEMVLLGLCFGGLGFLNSWDLPIYLSVCVVAYGLASYARQEVFGRRWLSDVGFFAVTLVALCFILYLPFWIGLRSQAGGIQRVQLVQTRFYQYLIMFGAFVYVCVSFLGYHLWRTVSSLRSVSSPADQMQGRAWMSIDGWRAGCARLPIGCLAFLVLYALGACLLVATRLERILLPIPGRFDYVWLLLLVGLGLAVFAGRLGLFGPKLVTSSSTFVLVLFLAALSLTLSVEFVFLKDVFGTRMNTVFKFYYQAWVLFGVSSAFGIYYLGPWIRGRRRALSGLLILGFVPIFLAGLVYPVLSTYTKTGGFHGPRTLDGIAHLEPAFNDELAAIRWLRDNAEGAPTIVEATGGSYSYYGRVSVHTGLPTLLGWGGHEQQWRGNYEEPGKREPDIETIYTSRDVEETAALLDAYDVQYVYVGPLERSTYQVSQPVLAKFESLMDVVFQQGEVTIYGRR